MALALLAAAALGRQAQQASDAIRFGLFSLFKPQVVEVRVISDAAELTANSSTSSRQLNAGDVIKFHANAGSLDVEVRSSARRPDRIDRIGIATSARITHPEAPTLELTIPGKIRRLVRGGLQLSADGGEGALKVVLTTQREDAVASVVAAELKGERSVEAIKALAVVVRTYMLAQTRRHSDDGFDFCDTTHCQLYRGLDDVPHNPSTNASLSPANATRGETLNFQGRPIEGFYTAACGGLSATPQMIWGGASPSRYPYKQTRCRWCRGSLHDRWRRSASATAVLGALSEATALKLSTSTELMVSSSQGFVAYVDIRDGEQKKTLKVDEFRRAIGRRLGWNTLLSPSFAIQRQGARFLFTGRGFGSQVGLCVAGSVAQAKAGHDYKQILKFYYPDADVTTRPSSNE